MPAGGCHLVPVDSTAVKQAYVRQWQQAQRDFARRQQEWHRFSHEERPAYERWVGQTFGARISELRATHQKTRDLQQLLEAIEHYGEMCGQPPHAVYQELLAEQQDGVSLLETLSAKIRGANPPGDARPDADDEAGAGDNGGAPWAHEPFDDADDADAAAADFDDLLDTLKEMLGGHRRPKPNPKAANERQLKIRDLYRKLCRRLHPDTGGTFNAETEALWHQLQDAYEKQDLDRLEAIQAGLEIRLDPMGKHVSCSQLAAVMADLKQGVQSLRAMLGQAKQDAAWGFSHWTAREKERTAQQLAADFEHDYSLLSRQLQYLENIVKKWSKPLSKNRVRSLGRLGTPF